MIKLYAIFPAAMGIVCVTIAFYEFLIWLRRRGDLYDISFATTALIAAVYDFACSGEYNVDAAIQSVPWLRTQSIALNLVGLSFLWYLSARTSAVPRSHLFAFATWYTLAVLTQLLGPGNLTWEQATHLVTLVHLPFGLTVVYREVDSGVLTGIQFVVGGTVILYALWVILRYSRRGHRKEARQLLWLVGIIGLAYVNDAAVSLGLYSFLYMLEYAWLAAVVFVALQRSADLVDAALAKRALVASEEKLRTFVEQSSEAIVMTDERGNIIEYNRASEMLVGVSSAEAVGKPIWSIAKGFFAEAPEDGGPDIEARYRLALNPEAVREFPQQFEGKLRRPDGSVRYLRQNIFVMQTIPGLRIGTISHDVTEIKLAEERLLASLEEKTMLLKEVHHRVKNNLQVVSSLLYLQSKRAEATGASDAITASRNQILSMALIHEDLYRSKDFGHIDFGAYLRRLLERLLAGFRSSFALSFVPPAESLILGLDQAIPCGLIVNELCTNVMKHAFPAGHVCPAPELRVELTRAQKGLVLLAVADNGIGMPPGLAPETTESIGMQIVMRLTKQLRGSIRLARAPVGSRIEIEFPVERDSHLTGDT